MMASTPWAEAISSVSRAENRWVLASVIGTQGSAPRKTGSKMLITDEHTFDTIGGGRLEHLVILKSRELLAKSTSGSVHIENFPLSSKTQQCCGGSVSVLLECFIRETQNITVFGAGHIAQSLVRFLAELDCRIDWVDSREELLATIPVTENSPVRKIRTYAYANIVDHVASMQANAYCIILTHDHRIDFALTEALLDRKDCAFIGVVGSETKSRRFRQRLKHNAFSAAEIDQLHCPIGLDLGKTNKPASIALSIAAEFSQFMNQIENKTAEGKQRSSGLSWKDVKSTMQINNEETASEASEYHRI